MASRVDVLDFLAGIQGGMTIEALVMIQEGLSHAPPYGGVTINCSNTYPSKWRFMIDERDYTPYPMND